MQNNNEIQEDEIDLFELWDNLMAEKMTIIISTVVVISAVVLYLLFTTPVYQSTAYVLPPEKANIQEIKQLSKMLNTRDEELTRTSDYSIDSVFSMFSKNLKSQKYLLEFFRSQKLLSLYSPNITELSEKDYRKEFEKSFEEFVKGFSIKLPNKKSNSVSVSITMSAPVTDLEIKQLLSSYIDNSIVKTKAEILEDLHLSKKIIVSNITKKIKASRKIAKNKKTDRIVLLTEAAQIAKNLNIKNALLTSQTEFKGVRNQESLPLYYLGYRSLEAEKKSLENRKTDDPFISGLRDNQEKLLLVESVNINKSTSNLMVAQLDLDASIGEKIKPKTFLTLAVTGVLGLFFGIMIVLVRGAFRKHKQPKREH